MQDLNIPSVESGRPDPITIPPTAISSDSPSMVPAGDSALIPILGEEEVNSHRLPTTTAGDNTSEPVTLTIEEQRLILNLKDPRRKFEWEMRCPTGHDSTYSAPVRIADREGRTKLLKGRTRAAPYQNGVFRFRMGEAQKQASIQPGGISMTQICSSPKSPRSDRSLPFPP